MSSTRHEGAYDDYGDRTRRTIYKDEFPERRPAAPSSTARSVANLPGRSVASSRPRDTEYRDYYDAPPSSSGRTAHKKVYSTDDARPSRLPDDREREREREYRRRDERDRIAYPSKSPRQPYPEDDGIYLPTDPGRLYSETEPHRRSQRRGSADMGKGREVDAERRGSAIDSYPIRHTARGEGPPPVTRGLDKVNEGLGRRASLREPDASRYRERGYGSQSEEDTYQESYRDTQRKPSTRAEAVREEIREPARPARRSDYDEYDDRTEPRRPARKWEDAELAKRGFGIRTGDVDPGYDRRDADRERRNAYDLEPLRTVGTRRDAGPLAESEEQAREREVYDDRPDRPHRRREDFVEDRKPRNEIMSETSRRNKPHAEPRATRERDALPDEWVDRHEEEDRRSQPRKSERGPLDEHSRRPRDDSDRDNEPVIGKALAGAAAVGAAGFAADEVMDHRRRERPHGADDPQVSDRDDRRPERRRAVDRSKEDVEPPIRDRHLVEDESPDLEKTHRRQYVGKEDLIEEGIPESRSKALDPDEEYRQRIALEAERVRQAPADPGLTDEAPERDRRRRDREERRVRDRQEPRAPPTLRAEGSSFDPDGQALVYYGEPPEGNFDAGGLSREPEEMDPRHARIVDAPDRKDAPRGILRKPTDKFPELPNQIREGVAPLQPVEGVPADARWTKINRTKVSPQTLIEANERFEERRDFVVVLRVVPREQIDKWAERTQQIRGMA